MHRSSLAVTTALAALLLFGPLAAATAPGDPDPEAPWVVRTTTVELTPDIFRPMCHPLRPGPPEVITLTPFPFDVTFQAEAESSIADVSGTLIWAGHELGHHDHPVHIRVTNACGGSGPIELYGTADLGRYRYAARPAPGRPSHALFEEIDTTRMPHRQGDDALERPAPPAVDAASRPVRRGATQQLPTVVDVVFLYTPHAARQAGGARNLRQHAVELADRMNRALADTRVEASIDVVDAQLATHYRSQVPEDVDVALRRVQNPKDRSVGAQAAKLRKQHSADLVALIVDDVAGDGVGGGLADTPDAPGRNTRHQAFSASGIDGAADETTSHEIGHNFGLDHERSPLGQGTPSKKHPTRTGSVTRDKRGYTIMAYLDDRVCVVDDDCTRIHRFADRIHTWRGQPIGDKDNDQRMVLRDTAPILAAYGTPQRPVLRHALKLSQSPGGTAWPAMWGPYRPGKQITVTAFPEPGYELAGWTFDGHRQKGTNTNFQVPMDRARSLRAHFRLSGATPLR